MDGEPPDPYALPDFHSKTPSSKVMGHVSNRFGYVEAVLRWDKTHMPARVIAAVEQFYEAGDKSAQFYQANELDYWRNWDVDFITAAELETSLSQFATAKVRIIQYIEHFLPIFGRIIHSYILPTFGPSNGCTPAKHTASMGYCKV